MVSNFDLYIWLLYRKGGEGGSAQLGRFGKRQHPNAEPMAINLPHFPLLPPFTGQIPLSRPLSLWTARGRNSRDRQLVYIHSSTFTSLFSSLSHPLPMFSAIFHPRYFLVLFPGPDVVIR